MSDLIRRIQLAQRNAGEAAVIAHLEQTMGALKVEALRVEAPRTYVDDDGNERRERRRKDRANDDPRIAHLFEGFDNMIDNSDAYNAGYLRAMRLEFGQLVASLVR